MDNFAFLGWLLVTIGGIAVIMLIISAVMADKRSTNEKLSNKGSLLPVLLTFFGFAAVFLIAIGIAILSPLPGF